MIRSSRHYLNDMTQIKKIKLDYLFSEYHFLVQKYIDLIWLGNLDIRIFLSSKLLPNTNNIKHSVWKSIAYKQVSGIIRSQYKKKTKPIIKNVAIHVNDNLFDIKKGNYFHIKRDSCFDMFIKLKMPFFIEDKKIAQTICLPINHHKQSLKYSDWDRKNTILLSKNDKGYFIEFYYEKEIPLKLKGKSIGFDCGYKKMLVDSNGRQYGKELFILYQKIAGKKQGSINFKQALIERDDKINEVINSIDLTDIKEVVVEDLKNVKHKTKGKIYKKFMNKLQRWTYLYILRKLERLCEENGVLFTKINPAYTSQECSRCHTTNKASRKGEFYKCVACNFEIDADHNAAINILHRAVYVRSAKKEVL